MHIDPSTAIQSVAVLGLGLIGGSLARDLAARGVRVYGWDGDAEAVQRAVDAGVVHASLLPDSARVHEADAVVFALPVLHAKGAMRDFAPRLKAARLITDVGSTKTSIVRLAEELGIGDRFVGSHPLAGDHRSGWDASRTGLFADARVFLCPTRSSTDGAMRLALALWRGVGARPEVIGADLHDVQMAWRSHLPQAVSTALALTIAQTGSGPGDLGPGGRDVTRLAGSSPEMWADILLDNADALDSALAMMLVALKNVHRAIADGDHAGLRRLLSEARGWHERGG